MADRPIIFSAPMVRALLNGRKTQTRRALKLARRTPDFIGPRGCESDPTCWGWEMPDGYFVTVEGDPNDHAPGWRNGWRDWVGAYAPGDRLWVREAFSYESLDVDRNGFMPPWYWADGNPSSGKFTRPRPSIHMPRWASRLTLTVTDVRVQRLLEISEDDARAEGAPAIGADEAPDEDERSYRWGFMNLWATLHPPVSRKSAGFTRANPSALEANPWVCAVTFTVHQRNIDQMPGAANA